MCDKHLTKTNHTKDNDIHTQWLRWCRLCAKRELDEQESLSIFVQYEAGKLDTDLATSVGKYFWVNIKADDAISQCLCLNCKQLVEELVIFTERVNKVQTLFCLLQNIKPETDEQADKLRAQCGLVDMGWQHIIKPEFPQSPKPLLIDQEIQTEEKTCTQDEKQHTESQTSKETEEIINILQKPARNEGYECQTETENNVLVEYVVQGENEMEFVDNDYMVPSNSMNIDAIKQNIQEPTEDEENVQDSDLFKELKYKLNDEEDEEIHPKKFKMISEEEEVEVEYQDAQTLEEEGDEVIEQSIEILEEMEVQECEEDYVDISDNQNETKIEDFGLMRGKRGRPIGSKNSPTDGSTIHFECMECKRRYKNPNVFRKHMSFSHNIVVENLPDFKAKSNTCKICSKVYVTQSSLKLHMRHHLPDEEKYNILCPYCNRKFSQVGAMRQHVNGIHHQMKPFICDQCGRACKTMAALTEHLLVHSNECPFECKVCHKGFKNKSRLKTHMDTHDNCVYKCPDCSLELNTKRTLLQHRLVHSDEKRFKCQFCEAAFKRSKALKNHLILHTGLRPYKCNFCNKAFSNGSNCRAHKRRAHPTELAEDEANGKVSEIVPIPKLEELKSAKGVLVQPRKVKRNTGGLPNKLRKLLKTSKKQNQNNSTEYEDAAENCESFSDFHYEICKSEIDETESIVDNPSEECEETVIYEIIDEI